MIRHRLRWRRPQRQSKREADRRGESTHGSGLTTSDGRLEESSTQRRLTTRPVRSSSAPTAPVKSATASRSAAVSSAAELRQWRGAHALLRPVPPTAPPTSVPAPPHTPHLTNHTASLT